ncbi:MAG: tripartite tricarboxylate transporter TctB family protein [Hydrogenophaga sp.]|nr:tripartite tricarboxylate transporter TctB family protein [Hydrogenophaga sp.]
MTTRRDMHDLVGGGLMTAVGLFFAIYGSRYDFGTTARMGAGYFPVVLGWTLAVLGLLVAVPAWWRRGTAIAVEWGSLVWCVLSLLLFAFTLHLLGVVLASFLTALLSLCPITMAWRTRLTVSAVVALLTTLIFPIGLQMILPIWPWSP